MTFAYRYRKQIIIGMVISFILAGSVLGGIFFFTRKKPVTKEVFKVEKKKTKTTLKKEVVVEVFKVDVKGEVINPGLYTLAKDSRVMDAIAEAGGLTENADTSVINLSKKIEDEMVIIVYSHWQVEDFKTTKEIEKQVQENCHSGGEEGLSNDACVETEKDSTLTGKVSINSASIEQLQQLPGIGESKAKSIIEYREKNGLFASIEDIQKVPGIGESIFAQIKENITT